MSKRCFLVVGSEGSGTYMLAEALVESGCFYVPEEIEEDLEKILNLINEQNIVIRRSIPHRNEVPDIDEIYGQLLDAGYEIKIIAIVRDPKATVKSIVSRTGIETHEALENMVLAWREIGELLLGIESGFFPITHEAVVGNPQFVHWLFTEMLGLDYPWDYKFYDDNAKYYSGDK